MTMVVVDKCRSSLMDEYSGRRGVDGLAAPNRASSIVSRDLSRYRDQNSQCNRNGSSGTLNPGRSTQNVGSDKTKILKSSSRWSAHGKEVAGNSSKVVPRVTNPVKPLRSLRNKAPLSSETGSSASSADVRQAEVANLIPASEGANRQLLLDQKGPGSAESTSKELRSTCAGPNTRPVKRTFLKKPASAVDSNRAGSSESVPRLLRQNASATRPGSRSLRGSSAPNPVPSDSAASISRKQMLKKRSSEGESSSSTRAKQPTIAESAQTPSLRMGISVSDTRQARTSQTSLRDNNVSASVRSRRLLDTSAARRPPQTSRRELQQMPRLQNSLSSIGYPHRPCSFSCLSTTESSHRRNLTSPSGAASARNLVNREGFRHYNNSGIAEVLLALDRIEQDDEMSFEQLLALESNLILSGLSFHDQHRDMRLDIDDMSYEELLALEERMGFVSTALSEEALAKCVYRSVYKPESSEPSFSDDDECQDDTKCSICQEEYVIGDEMGRLHCKHSYHVDCLDQWLRQKNWCPICKSSAASSSSSSS